MRIISLIALFLCTVSISFSQNKKELPKKGSSVDYSLFIIPPASAGSRTEKINFNVQVVESSRKALEYEIKLLKLNIEGREIDLENPGEEFIGKEEQIEVLQNVRISLRYKGLEEPQVRVKGFPGELDRDFKEIQSILSSTDLFLNFNAPKVPKTTKEWNTTSIITLERDSISIGSDNQFIKLPTIGKVLKKEIEMQDLKDSRKDEVLKMLQYTRFHPKDKLMEWQIGIAREDRSQTLEEQEMVGIIMVRAQDSMAMKRVQAIQELLNSTLLPAGLFLYPQEIVPSSELETIETKSVNYKEWLFNQDDEVLFQAFQDELKTSYITEDFDNRKYLTLPTVLFPAVSDNLYKNMLQFSEPELIVQNTDGVKTKTKLTHTRDYLRYNDETELKNTFFSIEDQLKTVSLPENMEFEELENMHLKLQIERPKTVKTFTLSASDIGKSMSTPKGYVKLLSIENDFVEYETQGDLYAIPITADSLVLETEQIQVKPLNYQAELSEETLVSVVEETIVNPVEDPGYIVSINTKGKISELLVISVEATEKINVEWTVEQFPDFTDPNSKVPTIEYEDVVMYSSADKDYEQLTSAAVVNEIKVDTTHLQYYTDGDYVSYTLQLPDVRNTRLAEIELVDAQTENGESLRLSGFRYGFLEAQESLDILKGEYDPFSLLETWSGTLVVNYPVLVSYKRVKVSEAPEHIRLINSKGLYTDCVACSEDIKVYNSEGVRLKPVADSAEEPYELYALSERSNIIDDKHIMYFWGNIAEIEYPEVTEWEKIKLPLRYESSKETIPEIIIAEPEGN